MRSTRHQHDLERSAGHLCEESSPTCRPLRLGICGGVLQVHPPSTVETYELEDFYLPFVCRHTMRDAAFQVDVRVELGSPLRVEQESLFDSDFVRIYNHDSGYLFNTLPRISRASWSTPDRSLLCSGDFRSATLVCKNTLVRPQAYPFYDGLDRLLLGSLVAFDNVGALVHSSAVLDGHAGYLFLGECGSGKSTMAKVWAAATPATVLSDECNGICCGPLSWRLHGTPWPSAARGYANQSAPLRAAFFLEHGTVNECVRLTPDEMFTAMLAQALIPHWSPKAVDNLLDLLRALCTSVPAARVRFRPDEEVISVIRNFVQRE